MLAHGVCVWWDMCVSVRVLCDVLRVVCVVHARCSFGLGAGGGAGLGEGIGDIVRTLRGPERMLHDSFAFSRGFWGNLGDIRGHSGGASWEHLEAKRFTCLKHEPSTSPQPSDNHRTKQQLFLRLSPPPVISHRRIIRYM